jgi:glycosyltransferase involved in cell wall biosynthesis
VFPAIADRLSNEFEIVRITYKFEKGALDGLLDHFDLVMLQNIGSIYKFRGNLKNVVTRMGGTRTMTISPKTRYDNEIKRVAAVIATNQKLKSIGERINDNTWLVPNGVDLDKFNCLNHGESIDDYNENSRKFVVGFVGNIHGAMCKDYKGYKYLVKAIQGMYATVDKHFILFGHNSVPHDMMPQEYRKMDCLVLPSIDEGCNNSITEAMACGVPVIITKVGFHGERLRDDYHCIFVKRDVQDIARTIERLRTSPELRAKLRRNGRTFVEINQDVNNVAERYRKIFNSILNKE